MMRREPRRGTVYQVWSERWGAETFILVASPQDAVPEGAQPISLRAPLAQFLALCSPGERRVFVEDDGEQVEYEVRQVYTLQ